MIRNSWLCKSVIVKFSRFFLIALTVTDINRCVSVYGGFSLKERDVLFVQFSYFSNLFRRVLVHFIMYYAVMCNSKGTVQSHVHNVMMFFLFYNSICLLETFAILLTKILCVEIKLTCPKHCGPADRSCTTA